MKTVSHVGSDSALFLHGLAFLAVLIWGATFISTKYLLDALTPLEILLYRSIIAYCALLALRPGIRWPTSLRAEFTYLFAGLFGITLYFIFENNALKWTYASNASLIVCAAPLLSALLAPAFSRQDRLSARAWLGCLLGLAGVGLVVGNGAHVLMLDPLGDMLAFLSALAWAMFPIVLNKIDQKVDKIRQMRSVFFYGLLTTVSYMLVSDEQLYNPLVFQPLVATNLMFLGLVASALCYVIWSHAVARLGVTSTMIYMYFVPVVTMLLGALLLHERITGLMIAGAALIVGGIAVYNARQPAQPELASQRRRA